MIGPVAAYALGVACFAVGGGYAVYAMWVTIAPSRAKMAAAIAPVMPWGFASRHPSNVPPAAAIHPSGASL